MADISRDELDENLASLVRQRADHVESRHRLDGAITGALHLIDRCSAKQQAATPPVGVPPPKPKPKCKACGGSGVSSKGFTCVPCNGKGVKQ